MPQSLTSLVCVKLMRLVASSCCSTAADAQTSRTVLQGAREHVLTRLTVIAQNAHLDEFVCVQAAVDFTRHRRSEAAAADQDGGFEGMGAGFEGSKLGGREMQR